MNRSALLTGFLLLLINTSVWAADANSCASKSAGIKASERDAYLKSCLAQVNAAANSKESEQQRRRTSCEQNAQNRKLQGNEKANYVASCANSNEAQAAAANRAVAHNNKPAAAEKPVRKVSATSNGKIAKQNSHTCEQQAKDRGLRGDERKKFLHGCK